MAVSLDKKESKLITVFLSGGMTGLSREEMTGWRNKIKECSSYYDMYVISPTDYFMNGDTKDEDEDRAAFLYDTYWVKRCDVVIVNMNNPNSIGTAQEMMLAHVYHKPIIMIASREKWDDIHSWLKQEANRVYYYEDYEKEDWLYEDVVDYAAIYE